MQVWALLRAFVVTKLYYFVLGLSLLFRVSYLFSHFFVNERGCMPPRICPRFQSSWQSIKISPVKIAAFAVYFFQRSVILIICCRYTQTYKYKHTYKHNYHSQILIRITSWNSTRWKKTFWCHTSLTDFHFVYFIIYISHD